MADEDMIEAMIELLIPQATIITPNSQEARRLCADDGEDGKSGEGGDTPSLDQCAQRILTMGCEFVLVTGTHENTTRVINTLYGIQGMIRADTWDRLPHTYHGSGCTLASAIAAMLANGSSIPEAIFDAQEYTWQTLAAGFRPGMGQHLPDRFFWARNIDAPDEESS